MADGLEVAIYPKGISLIEADAVPRLIRLNIKLKINYIPVFYFISLTL